MKRRNDGPRLHQIPKKIKGLWQVFRSFRQRYRQKANTLEEVQMNGNTTQALNSFTLDELTSAVISRLEGSRQLLEHAPGIGDVLEGIIDDATGKLRHLQKLSMQHDWPKEQRGEVSELPSRDNPRRTIIQCSAALSIWADQQQQRAPELEWQRFEELIEELRAAVPGTGPVKDEGAYYRGHCILRMMLTTFNCGETDRTEDANVLETAINELDKAIEF